MQRSPMEQLNAGELPRMVHWYDPRLLLRVGVRTIISSVFGQYADQRQMQAATDQTHVEDLVARYDYSHPGPPSLSRSLDMDPDGGFSVDYVADTGDGFEPTYALAYLLSQDRLDVPGAGTLAAGSILVMGGDQCYPQATREEYRRRLQQPFDWAFDVDKPQRKLFAIPGNHDWYDGLTAFDSLFCAARDPLAAGGGNVIGGWQAQQHRSYWAIRLPNNWWIWGADIQFSKYLDNAQVNYFSTIVRSMGPDDKIILCLAEPAWMLADMQGVDEEENFFKITSIARSRGSRIRAVIAGDWHHYNRYYTPELDVHFFTAGGGGSFLHPTHVLKDTISIDWPRTAQPAADPEVAAPSMPPSGGARASAATTRQQAPDRVDLRLKSKRDDSNVVREAVEEVLEPLQRKPTRSRLKRSAAKCYPSKATSLGLSFRNLLFPVYNLFFAFGIGVVYWLITWQFYSVVSQHDISAGKIDTVGIDSSYWSTLARLPLYLMQAMLVSIPFVLLLGILLGLLVAYVDAVERPRWRRLLSKVSIGVTHFLVHLVTMFALGLAFVMLHNWIAPGIERQVESLWRTRDSQPAIVREVLQETLEPLSQQRADRRSAIESSRNLPAVRQDLKPPIGMTTAPPGAEEGRVRYSQVRQLIGLILYPIEMVVVGGLVGGFIWGFYWVFTGVAFRMHAEDAFAALRIKDYKNFLRLRFEKDRLVIYPLKVDRIPRRSDWMSPPKDATGETLRSRLVPVRPIRVELIEEPIVIE